MTPTASPLAPARAAALAWACASLLAACGGGGSSSQAGDTDPGLPPQTNTFAGSVSYLGAPLAGATVIAFNTNTNQVVATATTDANGHYAFAQLGTSCTDACKWNYQFWATKAGYSFEPAIGNAADADRSGYAWFAPASDWAAASGAAVTREDFTGQFRNPGGGSAYILSVLNFDSVPNGSVADGNFIAHDGTDPLVHLAASGQARSYAQGDDADRHAGVAWPATRYVDHHDGSVTDTLTGLTWLKDAGCLAPATWGDALAVVNRLAAGACGLADGSSAGQWRLPNQWELESVVDLAGRKLQDQEAYRYFGLRGRTTPSDPSKRGRITLSHDYPKRNAAQSLIQCLADDRRLRSIRDWSRKVTTMERVLRTAISFDFAAVEVTPRKKADSFYRETGLLDPLGFDVGEGTERQRFIPIGSDRIEELDDERLMAAVEPASGVTFFLDGQPIELSSGQRLFAYIVINILGAIRRNSLILVDEPELFLHPTLEIQFVDMLKTILSRFNSKALLATHSVVTVREIPSQCVHVFEKTDDDVVLRHPPFQTFGGDFQRISSYVFGDKAVSKPFESWIKAQLDELETADALIAELGNDLNEELIVQIKAMERGQW